MTRPVDSRREFIKKARYVPPAILTLMAAPSFAKSGSGKPDKPDQKPPKPGKKD